MGHLQSAKSNLIPLIDRLNRYPVGLVDNDKLREILSILFDDTEALVASKFPLEEATLPELCRRTGMTDSELVPVLERMANKGLVMDVPYSGKTFYVLMPGFIGFMEFTFMRSREDLPMKKLAQLMTEYLQQDGVNGQASEFFGSEHQLTRSLVYEDQIPTSSQITSYESARDIIQNAGYHAVTMCYCRHKKEHLDKSCKKGAPVDGICMVLGEGARFLVRRGFATECTKEQMLDKLEVARSFNLTHVTDNIRHKPSFVCNCCHCCCELMAGVQLGYSDGIAKTPFIATIDKDQCDYCGDCFKACNVKTIGLDRSRKIESKSERIAGIDQKVCLGCGACLPACEKGAIELIDRPEYRPPLNRRSDLFKQMLKEKKRFSPYVISRIKKKIYSAFNRN